MKTNIPKSSKSVSTSTVTVISFSSYWISQTVLALFSTWKGQNSSNLSSYLLRNFSIACIISTQTAFSLIHSSRQSHHSGLQELQPVVGGGQSSSGCPWTLSLQSLVVAELVYPHPVLSGKSVPVRNVFVQLELTNPYSPLHPWPAAASSREELWAVLTSSDSFGSSCSSSAMPKEHDLKTFPHCPTSFSFLKRKIQNF